MAENTEDSSQALLLKIEELKDELNMLKEENSKTKRNLMWKVRKLEKDKVLTENEKIRLEREVKSLRAEVERFRSPPLVLATINTARCKSCFKSTNFWCCRSFTFRKRC